MSRDQQGIFGPMLVLFGMVLVLSQPSSSAGQDAAQRITLVETARATLTEADPVGNLSNSVSALGYSPDGSMLAAGMLNPNSVLLLDPATLAVRDRLEGHTALVSRVVFSPDGKTLVSSGHDGTVRVWDLATKRQRLLLDQFAEKRIRGLGISPDGKRIFTGEMLPRGKETGHAWDAQDGRLLGSLAYFQGIECLAVSPDGLTLATASRDKTIRLWDLATYTQKDLFDAKGPFASDLAYMPDGKSLAAVFTDKTIRVFDVATMSQKYQIETTAQIFLFLTVSPDGSILATADGFGVRLQLWRSSDGSPLASIPDTGGRIAAIQFSPDGRSVVVCGPSGFIRVFRLDRDRK
jgi:dipeptidyl aminopeptidase/acylaminoacyl peptidase